MPFNSAPFLFPLFGVGVFGPFKWERQGGILGFAAAAVWTFAMYLVAMWDAGTNV